MNKNGIVGVLLFQSNTTDDADGDQQQRQKEKEIVVGEVGEIKDYHQHHTNIYKRNAHHRTYMRP